MAQTIVVLKPAHFFSIDNDIIDVHAKKIGAMGLAIYAVLARYANRRTGECWPAISRIQHTLNLGRSCVKRYLHRLQAAGLITIEERWSEEGDRSSNRYTLLDPTPEAMAHHHDNLTPVPPSPVMEPEGGGSPETPPPVLPEAEGRSPENPEPDPNNQKERTIPEPAPRGKTLRQQLCPHPASDVHHFTDGIRICFHCYAFLDEEDGAAMFSLPDHQAA